MIHSDIHRGAYSNKDGGKYTEVGTLRFLLCAVASLSRLLRLGISGSFLLLLDLLEPVEKAEDICLPKFLLLTLASSDSIIIIGAGSIPHILYSGDKNSSSPSTHFIQFFLGGLLKKLGA